MPEKIYAVVAEGDVFIVLHWPEEHVKSEIWSAGLESNPVFVDVSDNLEIAPGWTWDGTTFSPPSAE